MKRIAGALLILIGGVAALPLAALPFNAGGENWIAPLAVALAAGIGAGVNVVLPVVSVDRTPRVRALRGIGLGFAGLVVGLILFWFALNGINGA